MPRGCCVNKDVEEYCSSLYPGPSCSLLRTFLLNNTLKVSIFCLFFHTSLCYFVLATYLPLAPSSRGTMAAYCYIHLPWATPCCAVLAADCYEPQPGGELAPDARGKLGRGGGLKGTRDKRWGCGMCCLCLVRGITQPGSARNTP